MSTKPPRQTIKPKSEIGMVLELNTHIKLNLNSTKYGVRSTILLDGWVANFQEALDIPHESYLLKDFCAEDFFKRRSGMSSVQAYKKMQEGDHEMTLLFVEFGQHVGALIANLEMLCKPSSVTLKGSMTETFDAWSHAMGKTRNKHSGKKPIVKIIIS